MTRVAPAIAAAALACACGPADPRVGKARLAEADAVIPAPASSIVVEIPGELPANLAGVVRVAADRDARWSDVEDVIAKIRAAGGEPVLLVARRGKIHALPPAAPRSEDALRMVAYSGHHQVCVLLPGVHLEIATSGEKVQERSCVTRLDRKHVDRAHVRALVRKAREDTGLTRVRASIDPSLSWADAIRAIDGARTCCGATPIEVSVETM